MFKSFLTEPEKQALKKFRYYDIRTNYDTQKGWLYYDIKRDVSPLPESRYFKEIYIFSSLLNRKVRGYALDTGLINEEIIEYLKRDIDLSARELGIPLLYWRREIAGF